MRFNEGIKDLQYKRNKKFILIGNEAYLKDIFINSALAFNPDFSPFFYYPGEEEKASATLFSSNLFDSEQIVILKYYDDMKINAKFKEIIKNYDGFLIIVLTEAAKNKTSSVSEMMGLCSPVQCSKMSEYGPDYPSWLVTKASDRGFSFVEGAENFLYSKVGPDMYTLAKELEKLILYKGLVTTITPEDIKKVVCFYALGTNYDIAESLVKKDVINALKLINLYTREEINELVNFLGHYFEKLYRIFLMSSGGSSIESIASILNMPPFFVKNKYLPQAKSLGREKISECLGRICALEVGLRISPIKQILIDKFIFSFI